MFSPSTKATGRPGFLFFDLLRIDALGGEIKTSQRSGIKKWGGCPLVNLQKAVENHHVNSNLSTN